VLAVAAVGAGQGFLRDPSGTALGMTTRWLAGLPFADFRVPGLFLTFVIGGANLLAAVLLCAGIRGRRLRVSRPACCW
jgi:hypothetical protein